MICPPMDADALPPLPTLSPPPPPGGGTGVGDGPHPTMLVRPYIIDCVIDYSDKQQKHVVAFHGELITIMERAGINI